jgi:hypothetical protein
MRRTAAIALSAVPVLALAATMAPPRRPPSTTTPGR